MRYILLLLVLLTTSCSAEQWNERLSTPEEREAAERVIELFREGEVEALEPLMEPDLFEETSKIPKSQLSALAVQGDLELVTVNSNSFTTNGQTSTTKGFNYQYGSGSKWFLFQVLFREADGKSLVNGWHATPFDIKPTTASNFSFSGKGFIHFFWIGAMVISTSIIVFAVIVAVRSKGMKHRWLWVVGCLFGLVQFSLNWTTGEWAFQPLYFSLLGSGFIQASPFDAWILNFSLPIIAIIFLWRRSRLTLDA
jgi:hypothetical protein